MSSMISPCIFVCTIDAEKSCCTGCGRTLTEIASWSSYSDHQRSDLMEMLPTRLEELGLDPQPLTSAITERKREQSLS
jgi:predicted Fe-S protein YdhL (DUF1289 family)